MAKQIFKFKLATGSSNAIVMPAGAEIVHVHEQDNWPHLWAIVDSRQTETERRNFHVATTGSDIPDGFVRYIGTAHLNGGTFVVHVFEMPR